MVLGTMVAEALLLVLVAVLIVVLMVTGPETAQQETGRINVTAVEKEDTSRETARTVLVQRRPGTKSFESLFLNSLFYPLSFFSYLFWIIILQAGWKLFQVTSQIPLPSSPKEPKP